MENEHHSEFIVHVCKFFSGLFFTHFVCFIYFRRQLVLINDQVFKLIDYLISSLKLRRFISIDQKFCRRSVIKVFKLHGFLNNNLLNSFLILCEASIYLSYQVLFKLVEFLHSSLHIHLNVLNFVFEF